MTGEHVRAYADTLVEIDAQPRQAVDDVEIGLYREDEAGRLESLSQVGLITVRGVARMRVRAGELVGAGTSARLYLVVARRGDLPRGGEPSVGDAARRALEDGGRRQVHPLTVELLASP